MACGHRGGAARVGPGVGQGTGVGATGQVDCCSEGGALTGHDVLSSRQPLRMERGVARAPPVGALNVVGGRGGCDSACCGPGLDWTRGRAGETPPVGERSIPAAGLACGVVGGGVDRGEVLGLGLGLETPSSPGGSRSGTSLWLGTGGRPGGVLLGTTPGETMGGAFFGRASTGGGGFCLTGVGSRNPCGARSLGAAPRWYPGKKFSTASTS